MDGIKNTVRKLGGRGAVALAALGVLLLWSYWTTLGELAQVWANDPQYSHGYLVPAFSLFLLWQRRSLLSQVTLAPSLGGLVLLALAAGLRAVGDYFFLPWLGSFSLLPALAGIAMLLGGKAALRWSWPALAFLVFMMPMPYRLQVALSLPLQRLATTASTYVLQTLGYPALAEGNIIFLGETTRIGVVEACNGLSMLVTFFALATAVALFMQQTWIHRALIVLSAVPIALLTNIIRIVGTAILTEAFGKQVGHKIFHDWAGWLMMPLALILLWLELRLLARILITESAEGTRPAWAVAGLPRPAKTAPAEEKRDPRGIQLPVGLAIRGKQNPG